MFALSFGSPRWAVLEAKQEGLHLQLGTVQPHMQHTTKSAHHVGPSTTMPGRNLTGTSCHIRVALTNGTSDLCSSADRHLGVLSRASA
jgi:hypothetical protein